MPDQLKLYVWEDVLEDYTMGVIFVLAHDVEEARRLVCTQEEWERSILLKEMAKEPKLVTEPSLFVLWGGG